jgi:hypothetical protein
MAGIVDPDRKSAITKLLIAAAIKPVNLAVLLAGVIAAVVLSGLHLGTAVAIAVLLLGVFAYAGLVGIDLQSRRFVEDTLQGESNARRMRIELSEDDGYVPADQITASDLRANYESIVRNFERVRAAFHAGNQSLQDSLRESVERCLDLVKEAGKTAQRGVQIRGYLDSESPLVMEKDAERLQKQAKSATDAGARANYQQAADAKRQQLQTYQQIQGLYDRVNAQLAVISTTLETANAKFVKLRATDIQEATAINESITSHIETVRSDIHILESTVEETMQEFSA